MTARNRKGRYASTADPTSQRQGEAEASIQRAFFQALKLYGGPQVLAFAVPNERKGKVETLRLMAQGLTPGAADVIILWPGGCLLAEFKAPGQSQRDSQKAFEARAKAAGQTYRVFHSWQSAWLTLEALSAPILKVLESESPLRLIPNPRLRQPELRAAE